MQRVICALLAGVWLIVAGGTVAQEAVETVDPRYTWDLTEIYPSDDAWKQARKKVMQDFGKIEEHRGTLGDSADSLVYDPANGVRCQQASRARIRIRTNAKP